MFTAGGASVNYEKLSSGNGKSRNFCHVMHVEVEYIYHTSVPVEGFFEPIFHKFLFVFSSSPVKKYPLSRENESQISLSKIFTYLSTLSSGAERKENHLVSLRKKSLHSALPPYIFVLAAVFEASLVDRTLTPEKGVLLHVSLELAFCSPAQDAQR